MDPLSSRLWRTAGLQVPARLPILCYHATPQNRTQIKSKYDVSADSLARHLDLLADSGWTTITLEALRRRVPLPPRAIMLTFDDGYANNLAGAFELLKKRDMHATWFIATAHVGGGARHSGVSTFDHPTLSAGDLQALHAGGMAVGSHTASHRSLLSLSHSEIHEELLASKLWLEDLLSTRVDSIAYPYGSYNEAAISIAREIGFELGFTTRSGVNSLETPRLEFRRLTIFSDDDVARFARKLSLADNDASWVKLMQYGFRSIVRRIRRRP